MISDFSDLERAGKDHALTINGGMMPTSEFNRVDGQAAALDLIQSGAGIVTPYGVVYDNGMKLEQVYDGRHFPEYHHEPCVASVALSRPGQDGRETLYLPCPDIKITRALQRLNAKDASQCTAVLDTDNICDAVRKVFEEEFKLNEHLDALNRLARCYQGFKGDDLEKFHTVFDHAWRQTLGELWIRLVASAPHRQHHAEGRQYPSGMRPSDDTAGAEGVRRGAGGRGTSHLL